MPRSPLRFQLLPMISILSLLAIASACGVSNGSAKPAAADGAAGYPNSGWTTVAASQFSKICPPASVEANLPYDLLVKYQAPCWGVALSAGCTAKLVGKAVKLEISYQKPSWSSDACYCEKETTCTLPALPQGDYTIDPQPHCAPGAVKLKVGATASGAPVCSATSGC